MRLYFHIRLRQGNRRCWGNFKIWSQITTAEVVDMMVFANDDDTSDVLRKLFDTVHERSGVCVLDDEYNCRVNARRVRHERASAMQYSSSSKHALYYYSCAN